MGRNRCHPVAALSAILNHDDSVVVERMEASLRPAGFHHLLLSRRRTVRASACGRHPASLARRRLAAQSARPFLRARLAEARRRPRRSLSMASRAECRRGDARLCPSNGNTRICYQSRVGPLNGSAPRRKTEIRSAGRDNVGVIVSPIAFVSEHVETLVELDIEYAQLAKARGLPFYLRAPALGAGAALHRRAGRFGGAGARQRRVRCSRKRAAGSARPSSGSAHKRIGS